MTILDQSAIADRADIEARFSHYVEALDREPGNIEHLTGLARASTDRKAHVEMGLTSEWRRTRYKIGSYLRKAGASARESRPMVEAYLAIN